MQRKYNTPRNYCKMGRAQPISAYAKGNSHIADAIIRRNEISDKAKVEWLVGQAMSVEDFEKYGPVWA